MFEALNKRYNTQFTSLPIDNAKGFPQDFQISFNGQSYYFRVYINIAAELLNVGVDFLPLPQSRSFLVVKVQKDKEDGSREIILLRKVVPDMVYETEDILLCFPVLKVARPNLNGLGDFGSRVAGGIAKRWG